jgi:hypothetical protein
MLHGEQVFGIFKIHAVGEIALAVVGLQRSEANITFHH